jgi:hypothetical protein
VSPGFIWKNSDIMRYGMVKELSEIGFSLVVLFDISTSLLDFETVARTLSVLFFKYSLLILLLPPKEELRDPPNELWWTNKR